ncbi:MAG TPA: EamA family transporter [Clostridiaceae bacterium]|nr:EamA family transporter [Clostridiaceae bacterium]
MRRPYIKYIVSLFLFGTNGIVASFISLSSYEIVFLRTLIGSLLLIAIFKLSGQKFNLRENKQDLVYIVISGIAMGTSWLFLYEAYSQMGVGIATLLYYFGPVIVMILSPLLFKERLTWKKLLGFAIVLLGEFLVNGKILSNGASRLGLLFGALSAVTYAVMVITNKKSKKITGLKNATLQLVIAFLTVAVFVFFKQGFTIEIGSGDWLPLLILGLVNTGAGCYLFFSSIGHLPVQTVAILGYLDPLSAVVFSVLVLNEVMLPLQVLGAILILGGAIFGEYSAKS